MFENIWGLNISKKFTVVKRERPKIKPTKFCRATSKYTYLNAAAICFYPILQRAKKCIMQRILEEKFIKLI